MSPFFIDLTYTFRSNLEEGDMLKPHGAAVKQGDGQWPNGVVPYTISSTFGKLLKYFLYHCQDSF